MWISDTNGSAPEQEAIPSAPGGPRTLESLAQFLADELGWRWRHGEAIRVEEYLARHAELANEPALVVRLIYEEMCVRRELGEEAPSDEYLKRFPQWRHSLEMAFECHRILEPDLARPLFPTSGDTLGDFQLVAELGRGLQGRVFLATQPTLADRPLVLKLTPRSGREHLSLARLQHTHIAPLFFVQEDPPRRLLILGMPYFGGATFAPLLQALADVPQHLRSGQRLVDTLDRFHEAMPVASSLGGRARHFLAQASAVQAVCWIGACLADALQYAHERGLVHLDVKPSNVLLTADGLPMLLDFHLAREPILPEGAAPVWLGGTPGYMSPEQGAALAALRTGQAVPAPVDARSDVYSLGLLLLELAGGPAPTADGLPPLRRRWDSSLPLGLFDILAKCLAKDPANRYDSAAELATDLRRQMADLPLRGVRNRSLVERWKKWRRRRPYGAAIFALVAVALGALAAVTMVSLSRFNEKYHEVRRALETGQRQIQNHQVEDALTTLRHGRELANGLPGTQAIASELDEQIRLAEQARAAEELHQVADRVRFLFGVDLPSPQRIRALEQQCWDIWEKREQVIARLGLGESPQTGQRIETDLLDLVILWTEIHVHLAGPGEVRSRCLHALDVLGHAEALFGLSPVLYHKRKIYAQTAGADDVAKDAERKAAEMPPRTAWENYSLGCALLRAGDFVAAAPRFDRAIELQPREFWAHYYKGLCAYRLNRFQDAVAGFSGCIILSPESAEAYFNRALALTALENRDKALRDYDRALQLDPSYGDAALNRGLLQFHQQRPQEALSDLQRALRNGADPATVNYNLALIYESQGNRAAALASAKEALKANPRHQDARQLQEKLLQKP
jgi:serine/threonine protein kinase/Flp pilus assembly protein TadD